MTCVTSEVLILQAAVARAKGGKEVEAAAIVNREKGAKVKDQPRVAKVIVKKSQKAARRARAKAVKEKEGVQDLHQKAEKEGVQDLHQRAVKEGVQNLHRKVEKEGVQDLHRKVEKEDPTPQVLQKVAKEKEREEVHSKVVRVASTMNQVQHPAHRRVCLLQNLLRRPSFLHLHQSVYQPLRVYLHLRLP